MWAFPLAAALVAFAFAASLGRRFARSPRIHLAMWCGALVLYALASLAVVAGAAVGWSRTLFEAYWIFGAVLNVPLLAAGEIHLLRRGPVLDLVVWIALAFVVAYTVAVTRGATIDAAALADPLPSGKEVFGGGTAAHRLPQLISIPSYTILVAGAAWSAWRMRGRPELRARSTGTLLVAAGATITAAAGSAFAAVGNLPAFSLSLLAGVAVMFLGFERATRARPSSDRIDPPRSEPARRAESS
ncbi:MAG: hypothetical protein ACRDG8_02425 [Actinomycetota bacterium]